MRKPNREISLRDIEISERVKEATRNRYHPVAIKAARDILSLPMPVIALMSMYEHAFDMDDTHPHVREAYLATIHYLRFGSLPKITLGSELKAHAVVETSGREEDGVAA